MKAEYFPPKEDVILDNEAPTDFYIFVTGAAVRNYTSLIFYFILFFDKICFQLKLFYTLFMTAVSCWLTAFIKKNTFNLVKLSSFHHTDVDFTNIKLHFWMSFPQALMEIEILKTLLMGYDY